MRVGNMELSANPWEGMSIYSPEFLEDQPTLAKGQADDLKLETGGFRYWLARCGQEDGELWQVHVERINTLGRWEVILSYRHAKR